MILRNLKITYKLAFLYCIIIFALIFVGAIGFASIKDIVGNFSTIRDYTVPSLTISSKLNDRVNNTILSAYNYLILNQLEDKENYNKNLSEAFNYQVGLFEITEFSDDVEFIESLNSKLHDINIYLDQAFSIYENDPNSEDIKQALYKSIALKNEISELLKEEVENRITVQAEIASNDISNAIDKIFYQLLIAFGAALLLLVVLIIFTTRSISRPINKLTEAASEIGKGNLASVKLKNNDEFGLFAKTFNKMGKDILDSNKALEKELEKTKKLDQQKTEFLSVAAHQLRTPSAGVKWVLDMATNEELGKLNKDQKHYLKRGLDNISRMTKIIDDLLNVSKIEEQRFNYDFTKSDLNDLIKSVAADFEALIKKKKLKIKFNLKDTSQIEIDKEKIRMVISNLMDNAIKYTNKGNITISTQTKGDNILFTIADTGVGIPKNSQDEIFTKFFRGKNILQLHQDGSGLGLFVVKDIIDKHNGKITFESEENKGTTFFIELNIKQKKKKDTSKEIETIISKYKKVPSKYLDGKKKNTSKKK